MQGREPVVVQLDPKCLHSALKEFFEPLRTDNPRADFFAVYRKESDVFDREYAKKYDEDLNTSLIFAGLFSAVSSAFIIDVQSKLEPDPNDMTAAYMQILIHAVNGSLFPNADPSAATWTGPPPGIVTVQSLLYTSLATSLFASFPAMLGKQWVNRYLRNRGGSAADKSRDRQRKLDGLERWYFRLVIESLPVILQAALLLLGCALSHHLWAISHTVAGIIIAFTLFGIVSYVFFSIAAGLSYDCPYQTPPSVIVRTSIRNIARSRSPLAHSLQSLVVSIANVYSHSTNNLRNILQRLHPGARAILGGFGRTTVPLWETREIPLAVVPIPVRIFEGVHVDWDSCKADTRCIAWMLSSTTDSDVVHSTVQFAADMIWYPEIAGTLSAHILAGLFFECLLDGRVIPDRLEHASSIGMALASVLSTQLSATSEGGDLKELCERINSDVQRVPSFESTFGLVVTALKFIAQTPSRIPHGKIPQIQTPERLSTTCKLWLSRVMLQTVWRWRRVQEPTVVLPFHSIELACRGFMADSDRTLIILETNCILIMAISLGLVVDIHDLYAPVDKDALEMATDLLHRHLRRAIREGVGDAHMFRSIFSALNHFDPFQLVTIRESCFLWIADILSSPYTAEEQYWMAGNVVELAWKQIKLCNVKTSWVPPLLGVLQLSENFYSTEHRSAPGTLALRILSDSPRYEGSGPTTLPILTSMLLPTHPLSSRRIALKVLCQFIAGWLPQMENVSSKDRAKLLQAVGDPFKSVPDTPVQDEEQPFANKYEPMKVAIVLIEFASLDLWRDHLHRSNFASCEEVASTVKGKKSASDYMRLVGDWTWPQFLCTPTKIIAAIERLEELQCPNTVEVVFIWAWTSGVVNTVDRDAWRLIGRKTLAFYRTYGMGRLKTLSWYIMDSITFRVLRQNPQCRVEGVRLPVRVAEGVRTLDLAGYPTDLPLTQVCQLRRLYQLFGCDPTTWEEVVAVERVGERADVSLGPPPNPVPFMDCACDYP